MKKLFILSAILLCFTSSMAQEAKKDKKREPITFYRKDKDKVRHRSPQLLQLSYGYRSAVHLATIKFGRENSSVFTTTNLQFNGPYILDMHSYVDKRWSAGMIFALDKVNGRYDQITTSTSKFMEFNAQVIVLLPYFAYRWYQRPNLELYSGAGLGYGFGAFSAHGNLEAGGVDEAFGGFTYQVTVAGVRFGKTIAAFAEVGYGDLGVVRA